MFRAVAARLVTAAEDVGVAVVRLADAAALDAVIATDEAAVVLAPSRYAGVDNRAAEGWTSAGAWYTRRSRTIGEARSTLVSPSVGG